MLLETKTGTTDGGSYARTRKFGNLGWTDQPVRPDAHPNILIRKLDALKVGQQIQATYRRSLGYRLAKAITITTQPAAPKLTVLRSDKKSQPGGSAPQTSSTTPVQSSNR